MGRRVGEVVVANRKKGNGREYLKKLWDQEGSGGGRCEKFTNKESWEFTVTIIFHKTEQLNRLETCVNSEYQYIISC